MLGQFLERKINLSRLVQLMSTNPAKIFNLYPKKGTISVDADSDLVIVNPDDILDNWKEKLVSITDWNAYADFKSVFPDKVINTRKLKITV